MSTNRRKFIQYGGLGALSFLLPTDQLLAAGGDLFMPGKRLSEFAIQIWSVKEDMAKDPKGTLKKLGEYGYKQIESFEGKDGIFWGMKNTEFKNYLTEVGTSIISAHCDISKDFERKAAEAAEIGMKYLICPYKGPQKSLDSFKRFVEEFNNCGDICKKNGIRFAYHNHDYSFKELEGQIPQVLMMEGTNPDTVDFEMDIYWVVAAGENPEEWMKKYKNRFRLCHIKDRMKTPLPDNKNSSCILGTGSIPFSKILKTAGDNGMKHFVIEQEYFEGTTPLESAKANAAYLKKLVLA
ncbi:MAG: hypothetical protein RLY16_3038 [Bacteroidota bacterium]|jgi:sugar phosphate isomerase/epimerase